jgi:cytoskeletal protein CcmA (bactofilin family)
VWKKEDAKTQGIPENPASSGISTAASNPAPNTGFGGPRESNPALPVSSRASACISQGIRIKGEVTGSEDLFIDGHFEGKLTMSNGSLTIGPNGEIKADITAREVIVRGRVDGKIIGREKIQLWSTGNVAGDLQTERLTIEDGAILRGRVEIETGRPPEKIAEARGAAAGASKPSASVSMSSGSAAS